MIYRLSMCYSLQKGSACYKALIITGQQRKATAKLHDQGEIQSKVFSAHLKTMHLFHGMATRSSIIVV
jgi:hypothetical protein